MKNATWRVVLEEHLAGNIVVVVIVVVVVAVVVA